MATTYSLEIVTPEGLILNEEITELSVMSESGEIGILANHASTKTKLKASPLKFKKTNGKTEVIAVIGGILEVEKNKAVVLTEFAKKGSDIDEALANQAAEESKAKIQLLSPDASKTDPSLILAEAQLQKELLLLKTARLTKNTI
ncbi:MAG: ATP synthase F1 subunit epsilon [Candidatus Caenarcaniphilales bacterium]|jgi:F-type H+-transporting ATPase subunit epsilon|nr:ATP synthase F1 subunit epsilon [Candidatus Caenarcaniphilales bacterium]